MSMNWKDPETKAKLLLAILASQEDNALSGAKAAKIAEYMGCTAKAVTHQLTALRKELTEFKAADGHVKPTVTPAKSSKRKGKGSDGEDSGSPTKKIKPTPKKKAPKAKKAQEAEEASDDEVDAEVAAARKDQAEGKEEAVNGEEGDAEDDVKADSD